MDSIIALLIILSIGLFYTYELFPDVKVWETRFFTIDSQYYNSVNTFMWVFMQKFTFLFLILIWFFTCKHWWKPAILFPVGMLLYQITILLNDEFFQKDTLYDKIFLIPFAITICVVLFLLGKKLNYYTKVIDLKEEVENEILKAESELRNGGNS